MEFWKADNNVIKTERSSAMRFNILKARNLLKLLEVISAMIIIFWSTTRLPIALKLLLDISKQTISLLITTPSIFLIGNAIIVTLFAQFRSLTSSDSSDLYEEFIAESRLNPKPIHSQELQRITPLAQVSSTEAESEGEEVRVIKHCRRIYSEKRIVTEDARKELRRSSTGGEKCEMGKTVSFGEVDELSGDAFKRRVEEFIAKQQRFIRDENMALVIST